MHCPTDTSLTQFNLNRERVNNNLTGKFRYNYKCKDTPYVEKTKLKSTDFNDECNGNAICLDRHRVQCPNGSLHKVQLVRETGKNPNSATGRFKYEYVCNIDKRMYDKTYHYTPWNDAGIGIQCIWIDITCRVQMVKC